MRGAPRVAVIGGGLAGLSAALALAEQGAAVELFEARRTLGGRAGSYIDPATGEAVDHCQHVAMGCCTNFLDFCRRTEADALLRRIRVLHFFGPDGRRFDFRASGWLHAPLHLAAGLWRLGFLTRRERLSIAKALRNLAAVPSQNQNSPPMAEETIGHWLRRQGQTARTIELFWSVILTSALSESVDRASLAAARKVFIDGFMASRRSYEVYVPAAPLATIYDERVARRLRELGAVIHCGTAVERLFGGCQGVTALAVRGESLSFDDYILAAPWQRAGNVLAGELRGCLPELAALAGLPAAPITAVHLWFERPITHLDHAVFIGRLSQWLFSRECEGGYCYQVVISASRELAGVPRDEIVARVCAELASVFPEAESARPIRSRVVTDREAVFAPEGATEAVRPGQTTAVGNLFLAGDWTATGWPATMESAVRSGRLAAEAVLARHGRRVSLVTPDLPRGWLARRLIRSDHA